MAGTFWHQSMAVGLMVAIAGCGNDRASVSGKVTLAGKPLANATIYFRPQHGPLAQSPLDANGHYELKTPGVGWGVAPGKYRIYLAEVTSEEEELAKAQLTESDYNAGKRLPVPRSRTPSGFEQYFSATATDLVRDVVPGSNEINFDLTRK